MKNIIKNGDAMAEARKSKKFQEYSEDAALRLKLAIEVYKGREKIGLSQQKLAKEIGSTQKVISRIESGDVNVGIELLDRLAKRLNFNSDAFVRIFGCSAVWMVFKIQGSKSQVSENKTIESNISNSSYKIIIK